MARDAFKLPVFCKKKHAAFNALEKKKKLKIQVLFPFSP
jgi:hypothetical protein